MGECESVHSVTAGQRARIGGLPKPYFVVGKSTEEKGSSKVYVCEGGKPVDVVALTDALRATCEAAETGAEAGTA